MFSNKSALSRFSFVKIFSWFPLLLCVLGCFFLPSVSSAEATLVEDISISQGDVKEVVNDVFVQVNEVTGAVLFYKIYGFPMLVVWLLMGGVIFTFCLGFANVRLFPHAFAVIRGKYSSDNDPGEISHFRAFSSAVSATVGLGNIGGVALAVYFGGPGAIFWMMVCGFFGMSTKFAEVTMGLKYREFDSNGRVNGGAYEYLSKGLARRNLPQLGKFLALIFAICCICGSLGAGNIFQVYTSLEIASDSFPAINDYRFIISVVCAVLIGFVIFGGITRVSAVAAKIVPFMAVFYVASCFVIIVQNIENFLPSIALIVESAFDFEAATYGFFAAFINGLRRAFFSSEAGIGSAPTAHSTAKTKEPVREGCVALLEPFVDTIIVCFMTGMVIVTTGVYTLEGVESGATLTSLAFATVSDWFPILLTIAVALFAFSTMLTWGYYGSKAAAYLFGDSSQNIYKVIFCIFVFFGGIMDEVKTVVDFSDNLYLAMAIPNLIGLYIMSGEIRHDVKEYIRKLKAGEFKVYK